MEAFDKAETSFVSITQSFNTTTSLGRLTLNMLLSFAQFEREVTAERMEALGYPSDRYNVIAFGEGKTAIFAKH